MHAYRAATRAGLILLAAMGWTVAGLLCWLLIERVGPFGLIIIGLAVLFISYRASLDDDNAVPDFASGINPAYKAQYQRALGGSKPEERAAFRSSRSALDRFLYVARTFGVAILFVGIAMFLKGYVI
jgi:hypothetical protein